MSDGKRNDEPTVKVLWPNTCTECSSDYFVNDYRLIPYGHPETDGVSFVAKSDYDALKKRCGELERRLSDKDSLLEWLRDGIAHFTNDEDRGQVEHLQKRIDEALNPQASEKENG